MARVKPVHLRRITPPHPPARDEIQPLVLRSRLEVSHYVSPQMQHDTAKVGHGEQRHLYIAEVVHPRGVVWLVEESMGSVIDRLVISVSHELFLGDGALDAFRANRWTFDGRSWRVDGASVNTGPCVRVGE